MDSASTKLRENLLIIIKHYEQELVETETLITVLSDETFLKKF